MRQEQGGCSGQLRCGKATYWEGGIRVPAFIQWDGIIEPRKSDELFSALDILPTVMNAVNQPLNNVEKLKLHGIDQSKAILSRQKVNKYLHNVRRNNNNFFN